MKRILILIMFLTTLTSSVVSAQTVDLKNDFTLLSGVIIMPIKDQYLIDLDASSGVEEGDIFTLVKEGEKVIHPVTKEILGTLEVPVGFLQITQIKSGYSYAKPLSATITPQKGDKLKRFEQVPATIDATVPEKLRNQLQADLPQLEWTTSKPLIVFSYLQNQLNITNADGTVIRNYPFIDDSTAVSQVATPTTVLAATATEDPFSIQTKPSGNRSVLNSTVNNMLDTIGLGSSDSRLEAAGIMYSNQENSKVWISTPFSGRPTGITVGDFDHDNQQEIALVVDNQLQIVRLSAGNLSELESLEVNNATTILGIDSMDLDEDGYPEIILNSVHDSHKLNSQIIKYDGQNFIPVAEKLRWYLRSSQDPEKGPILLGQALGSPEEPFSQPVKIFKMLDGQLLETESLNLNPPATVFAFTTLLAQNGEQVFATISAQDRLQIYAEKGTQLWESGIIFGGSESSFYARATQRRDDIVPLTFVQPKPAVINNNTILVPQNDGSRLLQRLRSYDPSRVVAMTWDGSMMKEVWHTMDQPAYLADMAVADADNDGKPELATLVRFTGRDIISSTESNLVLYQLDDANQ